jgi:hypothetical protein
MKDLNFQFGIVNRSRHGCNANDYDQTLCIVEIKNGSRKVGWWKGLPTKRGTLLAN